MSDFEVLRPCCHNMGEINATHPFRDGNGRTQREFIRQLAGRNGYALDWSRVSRDQMADASQSGFQHGDNSDLEDVLRRALDNEQNGARESNAAASPRERNRGDEERER